MPPLSVYFFFFDSINHIHSSRNQLIRAGNLKVTLLALVCHINRSQTQELIMFTVSYCHNLDKHYDIYIHVLSNSKCVLSCKMAHVYVNAGSCLRPLPDTQVTSLKVRGNRNGRGKNNEEDRRPQKFK